MGGPLDGLLLDVTDGSERELREVALTTEIGRYGPGGRAPTPPAKATSAASTGAATPRASCEASAEAVDPVTGTMASIGQ